MSNVNEMSVEELEKALAERRKEKADVERRKRDAYEAIRADVVHRIRLKVRGVVDNVGELFDFIVKETSAFRDIMSEYGQLRTPDQMSFKIEDAGFRVQVKCNKVKRFDERADIAAARLIEFLQVWMRKSNQGEDDTMYQLAMTLLERNRDGDLDYKSVSKLYDYEKKFNDPEYSAIMQLFTESNVVEGTAINYYFEEKDNRGVWRRLEPSFNRL